MDLEKLAKEYVNQILNAFDRGSFTLFRYNGVTYGGVSQVVVPRPDKVLVRVVKVRQPLNRDLLEYLVKKCNNNIILEVDDSINLKDRDLFYARLTEGRLIDLTDEERTFLVDNSAF